MSCRCEGRFSQLPFHLHQVLIQERPSSYQVKCHPGMLRLVQSGIVRAGMGPAGAEGSASFPGSPNAADTFELCEEMVPQSGSACSKINSNVLPLHTNQAALSCTTLVSWQLIFTSL